MPLIAGHEFGETAVGRRCTKMSFITIKCDMLWVHVRSARKEDIGHHGFAHQGGLDEKEFYETP